ncbi:MAG TPA: DNA mismatch repair endonuclease MutL [Candidatus Omnitrophica bacterium]|nr:MAG: hypothetical protein A2Z81_04360 [Omnitrophica WOR_2 bacterium GWA2_45_18]HBR14250.1 DNA mismatch repair endonuclease MutL [Candidatus Omnitrophota bacterium]
MKRVHLLPPDVISKIAAGEVIERPASVVKELIENALDAQTAKIELHLREAGKTSIHLNDTGTGIAHEDIETIFLRHSTSKITTAEDLFDIHSLGFRGEALYSVAAIADVVLRSKPKGQETGWQIHMRGGEKLEMHPVNIPEGTQIEIRELFFNTPARRKFLKSNVTEMNQILNILIPYAMLYPDKHFTLTHEDKTLIDLKPSESRISRIAEVLHLDEKHILETSQHLTEKDIRVRMILGDINIARSRRDMQYIFINNRPVENKTISFHMNNVYRLILPEGRYPFFVLMIDIPSGEIDVNIHPTKREVKIRDEQNIVAILRHLCENALMRSGQAKQVGQTVSQANAAANPHADTPPFAVQSSPTISERQIKPYSLPQALAKAGISNPLGEILPLDIFESFTSKSETQPPTEQYTFPQKNYFSMAGEALYTQKKDSLHNKLSQARFLGAFMNKFLFFETESSVLIIDQHAAQERVSFEALIRQMEKGAIEVQHLLSPYIIKLSPQELLIWEEAQERLNKIGFASTQFDQASIAVHTHPVLINDTERAVREILSGENPARCDHEALARRACRASVMAGAHLSGEEIEYQRQQLLKCLDPFTCPHGRPTVIEMTENYLNKQFLRT